MIMRALIAQYAAAVRKGEIYVENNNIHNVPCTKAEGYFEHGNVRIIIREHFNNEGRMFGDIISEAVIRQAKYTGTITVSDPVTS